MEYFQYDVMDDAQTTVVNFFYSDKKGAVILQNDNFFFEMIIDNS